MSEGQDPSSLLDSARGRSIGSIAQNGVGAWLLAVAGSVITGTQELVQLLVIVPAEQLQRLVSFVVGDLFLETLGIVPEGADATSSSLSDFGVLAIVVAIVIVLVIFRIINAFRAEEPTSNLIPGLGFDIPTPFIDGPEEDE